MSLLFCAIILCCLYSHHFLVSAKSVKALKDVTEYLTQFGYLDETSLNDRSSINTSNNNNYLTSEVVFALKNFQLFFGLLVTGQPDEATMALMSRPRCGNSEPLRMRYKDPSRTRSNFTWTKRDLTYRVSRYPVSPGEPDSSEAQQFIEKELAFVFSLWAEVVGLTFIRSDSEAVDIDIRFVEGDHGDNVRFDGPGMMIAHAFGPNPRNPLAGDIHFDSDETWVLGTPVEETLHFRWGAIHEIGHAIGLEHSHFKEAYMFPVYPADDYDPDRPLHVDDISRIQELYRNAFGSSDKNVPSHSPAKVLTTTPPPKTTFQPEQKYNTAKLQQFTEGLSDVLFAFNPISPARNPLVCKQAKRPAYQNTFHISSYLCIPDKYVL